MSISQTWRDFICDPTRSGRFLSAIGRATTASTAAAIDEVSVRTFLDRLSGKGADAGLLAEAVDLSHPRYLEFCLRHLSAILDSLANERVGEDSVVGPAMRGHPRWDRTVLARRTLRIPSSHYVSRVPERSFALPENQLVRWLVGSLLDGISRLEARLGSRRLPPHLSKMRERASEAMEHEWFRTIETPYRPTQAMLSAAARQRLPAYRVASALATPRAARLTRSREARYLATLDLLKANWLEPTRTEDLFELYALTLTLDVMEHELGYGPPVEYGLAVSGRAHVAAFAKGEERLVVFFNQSPQRALGVASRYAETVSAHLGVTGAARRPDVTIARYLPEQEPIVALVEVKETVDRSYTTDSVYKAFGYIHDFHTLWETHRSGPRVILLFPEGVAVSGSADMRELDVALVASTDRAALVEALRHRLHISP